MVTGADRKRPRCAVRELPAVYRLSCELPC